VKRQRKRIAAQRRTGRKGLEDLLGPEN